MVDQTQNDNDYSSGFLIKDKEGKFKKVKDDKIDDYSSNQEIDEDFVPSSNSTPSLTNDSAPAMPQADSQSMTQAQNINKKPIFNPQPAMPLSNQASFVGQPDEEEEIRNHQAELNKILQETPTTKMAISPSGLVGELLDKFQLKFANEILAKRFEKIVESKIKGIRSSIETEEVLKRPSKVGGLELTEQLAGNIVNYIDKHPSHQEIPAKKDLATEIISSQSPDNFQSQQALSSAPPDFIPVPKKMEPSSEEMSVNKSSDSVSGVVAEMGQPDKKIEKVEMETGKQVGASVESLYEKSPSETMSRIAHSRQREARQPQVNDIRHPSNIVGPVEELMQVDIKEFRRLGNNPIESANKVLEKIYLLEDESWQVRMEGIAAWQKSPLHMLYVDIGKESLDKDKSVVEIISTRESSTAPVIHMEEFLALNDLNSKLVI